MIALSLDNSTKADMLSDFNTGSANSFGPAEGSRTALNVSARDSGRSTATSKWSDKLRKSANTNGHSMTAKLHVRAHSEQARCWHIHRQSRMAWLEPAARLGISICRISQTGPKPEKPPGNDYLPPMTRTVGSHPPARLIARMVTWKSLTRTSIPCRPFGSG